MLIKIKYKLVKTNKFILDFECNFLFVKTEIDIIFSTKYKCSFNLFLHDELILLLSFYLVLKYRNERPKPRDMATTIVLRSPTTSRK